MSLTFDEKIDKLIEMNLPIPAMRCDNCQKTIYHLDKWFQCPDCGCLSTEYGGYFTHVRSASEEWIKLCEKSKQIMIR